MSKPILAAVLAAVALGAAQAVTVDWAWSNYATATPSTTDRWAVKSLSDARTFTFTIPASEDVGAGTAIAVSKLIFGAHNNPEGTNSDASLRRTTIAGLTIADSSGATIADVGPFTEVTDGGALYTGAGGNNATPNAQVAEVAGITLVVGETYTVTLDQYSAFALIQTTDDSLSTLTGSWVAAMGIEGTYDDGTLVPEPTALALLALGVAGVALRRRLA